MKFFKIIIAISVAVLTLAQGSANELPKELRSIFTDEYLTVLKKGVTQSRIDKLEDESVRRVASELLAGTYESNYRIQSFEAYPTVEATAEILKTSRYNQFENPTGIYFREGDQVIVILGDTGGERVVLRVHDLRSRADSRYELVPGLNRITISTSGLGYMLFYTDKYETVGAVKAHIIGGKVNGYFDKNLNRKDEWKTILENTVCEFVDIKGDYVNLTYLVEDLIKYCRDGLALIGVYDEIVYHQYDIMGLVKYGRVPKNHMYARWVKSGFFADGTGAGFDTGGMRDLADPLRARREGIWGIAHELGHVNQMRPGLKWHGTVELTNNIYSIYTQYIFAPDLLALERYHHNDGDNNYVIGGRFNSYLNYGIMRGEKWLFQKGPDKMKDYDIGKGVDHFVKLCPVWQLMLYYQFCDGTPWYRPDWYKDIAELARTADDRGKSSGELQLQFMKNVCDVTGEDLTDFFIAAGMLKPVDIYMDDYGWAQHTITNEDCRNLTAYASQYPKPATPVLYYLSANSLEAYKNKLPVTGIYGLGVNMFEEQEYCIIDHKVWRNAAVFETYGGDELIRIAVAGTDSNIQASTLVRYPENATRIEAVAWDGERTLVYGKRHD